eukprot:1576673-Amphidinium_carterae.1
MHPSALTAKRGKMSSEETAVVGSTRVVAQTCSAGTKQSRVLESQERVAPRSDEARFTEPRPCKVIPRAPSRGVVPQAIAVPAFIGAAIF